MSPLSGALRGRAETVQNVSRAPSEVIPLHKASTVQHDACLGIMSRLQAPASHSQPCASLTSGCEQALAEVASLET